MNIITINFSVLREIVKNIKFARKIAFDQDGFESDIRYINMDTDSREKAESFRRRFGLNSLFDLTIGIPKEEFLEKLVFDPVGS